MTNQPDRPESDQPIEEQGLPTSPVRDDEPGRSFSGDEPEAGSDPSMGTRSDDATAEDADAGREADAERQAAERAHESLREDTEQRPEDNRSAPWGNRP